MTVTRNLILTSTCLITLAACGGGSSSNGGGNGGDLPDPLQRIADISYDGAYQGETDWGHIDKSTDQHIVAADMAFLVREMEVAHLTPGREFLSGNLKNSMQIDGGCGGTFQTDIPDGGTPTASAGSGTFTDFCIDDIPLSGTALDPYTLASGGASWDLSFEGPELNGYTEMEDVTVEWRGETFTLNSRMEYEGTSRFFVMDVTLNDRTYRFQGVFIPATQEASGSVFWVGLHPEFGKFRIDQDIYDSDDQIFDYLLVDPYPTCLGPTAGAQTMSEPGHGARFQFRATNDCRTYTLNGQDSTGAAIDSDDHEWLEAIISDSVDSGQGE